MIRTLVIEHTTSPFVVLTRTYLCPPSWHRQHLPTSLTHQHCLHTPTISTLLCPRLHFLLGRVLIYLIQRISFLLHIGRTLGMRISNGFYSTMVDTCSLVVPEVSYPRICKANGQKMVITCGAVVRFLDSFFHLPYPDEIIGQTTVSGRSTSCHQFCVRIFYLQTQTSTSR
jgi:hypothetical protein